MKPAPHRKKLFDRVKRAVVKVGSNVLTENNGLNLQRIESLSRQISGLTDKGLEVIFVSSGAMASGIRKLGLSKKPDEIPKRQAIAAVGQPGLMMEYEKAFARYDKKVAQILLTNDGLSNRKRYLNARNTIHTLLDWKVIPIINENDTVSVDEIKFGDNDNLAALIAVSMNADILIILSDVAGLYTRDPRKYSDAELILTVRSITKDMEMASTDDTGAFFGTGGMFSKIRAAKKAVAGGIPTIIAKGEEPDILLRLFSAEELGTHFVPKNGKLPNRKCWIAFTQKPKGVIRIDDGAVIAILEKGKSLLPGGIIGVDGDFGIGVPVAFKNGDNEMLGTGLVNYSSADIRQIMGLNSNQIVERLGYKPYDEVIHRDNLVLTGDFVM